MSEDRIRELAHHLTDVLADRWHVNRCGTDQADDVTCVAAFLRERLTVQIPEDQIRDVIAQWRARANERGPHGGFPRHSERTIATLRQCADELEALLTERPPPQEAQLRHLASAMRKVLPPELLAEVVAHLDPLTPFVEFLSKPLGSPTP